MLNIRGQKERIHITIYPDIMMGDGSALYSIRRVSTSKRYVPILSALAALERPSSRTYSRSLAALILQILIPPNSDLLFLEYGRRKIVARDILVTSHGDDGSICLSAVQIETIGRGTET